VSYRSKQAKSLRVSDRYSACLFAGRFFHSLINAGMTTEQSEKSKASAIIRRPMQAGRCNCAQRETFCARDSFFT
jgi:hypothetical protein